MGINYSIQNGLSILYIENSTLMVLPELPPSPLSSGGAPPTRGPPGPRGIRLVIIRHGISAPWFRVCHSAGTPIHYSRTSSSSIWPHIPWWTSCNTWLKQRRGSSSIPSASSYGSCAGPTSTSSRLCLSPTPVSTREGRNGPRRAGSPTISTSHPRGPTSIRQHQR